MKCLWIGKSFKVFTSLGVNKDGAKITIEDNNKKVYKTNVLKNSGRILVRQTNICQVEKNIIEVKIEIIDYVSRKVLATIDIPSVNKDFLIRSVSVDD